MIYNLQDLNILEHFAPLLQDLLINILTKPTTAFYLLCFLYLYSPQVISFLMILFPFEFLISVNIPIYKHFKVKGHKA